MVEDQDKARSKKIIAEAVFEQERARMHYDQVMRRIDKIIKEVERDAERLESAGPCDEVHEQGR